MILKEARVTDALHRERLAVCVNFFTLGMVFASYAGRIPELKTALSLSDGQLGISMFCMAVGSLISMPCSAALGGRFGTARATTYASIAFCLSLMILPATIQWGTLAAFPAITNWAMFSAALFVFGFAMGAQDVSMNAHAVEVERRYSRTIMSSFHGMFSMGAMCGAALRSVMNGMQVGINFHFTGVCFALIAIIAFTARYLRSPNMVPPRSSIFVLPDRHIFLLSIFAFCSFIGEGAVCDWSAVYLAQDLHSGRTLAAAGLAAFCLSMTVCRLTGDSIVAKFGTKKILIASGIIASVSQALALIAKNPIAAIIAYLFVGIGFACMVPVAFSAAGKDKDVPAATAIAGVATLGYAGFVIAPPIIGLLADRFGLSSALWVAVGLSAAVALLAPAVKQSD